MSQPNPQEDIAVAKPAEKEKSRARRIPPYHVILLNDDHHTAEFVVSVLQKALGFKEQRAHQLMLEAHERGRSIVWSGPKEVAELKMEQLQTFHEVRPDGVKLGPVSVVLEPAPE